MAKATLTISSKNYSSWSLRGWLLTRFSGLEFDEVITAPDDASARAEILLLSSSILVPCLRHEGATVWDTLAIAEYLNEVMPDAGLLPADRAAMLPLHAIGGQEAGVRHRLVEIFGDRQRVPDGGALVPQARHQDRRRQQQDFGPRRGVVGGGNDLLEGQAGEFREQPASQRPRRVILAADGQCRIRHMAFPH